MKKIICFGLVSMLLFVQIPCHAKPKVQGRQPTIHAQAACVMDASTYRILWGKNEEKCMPMASTTKILTCILALEKGRLEDYVSFSHYATTMPKVHLGAKEGECYRLGDLLYAMMLESYNDVAVAIAEHLAGSVENFQIWMNQKAHRLCGRKLHFVTPNGLDAQGHAITAKNLAKLMAYCTCFSPKKNEFLAITGCKTHTFKDKSQKRIVCVHNHNRLLGNGFVRSGKTGFTNKAGYCYVAYMQIHEHPICVALLADGWPPNSNWKWRDMNELTRYLEQYGRRERLDFSNIKKPNYFIENQKILYSVGDGELQTTFLYSWETLRYCIFFQKKKEFPLQKGERIGEGRAYINDICIARADLLCNKTYERITFLKVIKHYFNMFISICIKTR
ncbi:D-alanyl-D-alanine carboxypeptidase (penicillin-binding protein 5/6) [Lachnospiraceae bacterium XBB1006]|nr:D-alanyl-D-alanine carboxypeptidase (penicillin-binding protein 5/6) [Lachnospiraceae bacterium XBB1006]